MDSKRTRRVLIVAFVLSLLIHAVVATGVRWSAPVERVPDAQVVHLDHVHPLPIVRRTPPPATPTPAPPTAAPSARPEPRPRPRKKPSRVGAGAGTGAVAARSVASLPSVTPRTTPTPNCASDLPAALASAPPIPDIPPAARAAQTSGVARVKVTLDASGAVRDAAMVASTGNPGLDALALQMARAARYTPARHACAAVAGTYTFAVRFSAW
ncbi:MAG: TonB family protein [bacterium]|nr:TonB family protein [bacterium]